MVNCDLKKSAILPEYRFSLRVASEDGFVVILGADVIQDKTSWKTLWKLHGKHKNL